MDNSALPGYLFIQEKGISLGMSLSIRVYTAGKIFGDIVEKICVTHIYGYFYELGNLLIHLFESQDNNDKICTVCLDITAKKKIQNQRKV